MNISIFSYLHGKICKVGGIVHRVLLYNIQYYLLDHIGSCGNMAL